MQSSFVLFVTAFVWRFIEIKVQTKEKLTYFRTKQEEKSLRIAEF